MKPNTTGTPAGTVSVESRVSGIHDRTFDRFTGEVAQTVATSMVGQSQFLPDAGAMIQIPPRTATDAYLSRRVG
ncbi:hypothetical protein E1292_08995 [Nonomuraea deserti]|uniref:Uncharacterized protein n=1 Tax=Nonomuraea deserti TaxID=1848322 RepID=A0A4V2YBZ7_9ACTN|nr:hypothetical protein E1292_08995 [Nonomuraea deserti]